MPLARTTRREIRARPVQDESEALAGGVRESLQQVRLDGLNPTPEVLGMIIGADKEGDPASAAIDFPAP